MNKITQILGFMAILLAFIFSTTLTTEAATKEFKDVPKNHSNYEAKRVLKADYKLF